MNPQGGEPDCKSGVWRHGRFDSCHTHVTDKTQVTEEKKCCVCGWRKAECLGRKCCRKCAIFTASEGTREKFGLPKPVPPLKKTAPAFVAAYNKAMREGAPLNAFIIAQGISWDGLRNKLKQLKEMGFELEPAVTKRDRAVVPEPPKPIRHNGRNGHGEGKVGVAGCKCQLCLDVRTQTRRQWVADNPDRMKVYRKRQLDSENALREAGRKAREGKPS